MSWVMVQLFAALHMLAKQSLIATRRHLTAMPYLEEAVALYEDPKGGKSWSMEVVRDLLNARAMLADCYYKLGRYDDAAAIATMVVQACKVRPTAVHNRRSLDPI
jgi:tetratricopeptide (TPR) repeat protein